MLTKKESDFFRYKVSLMYRNGNIGLTVLMRSAAACISALFSKKTTEIKASEIYFGLYDCPDEIICRLFKSRYFSFAFLIKNIVSWIKFLIRHNNVPSSVSDYVPSFDEFIEHFRQAAEKYGGLDRTMQKTFVHICGERIDLKFFFPNVKPEYEHKCFKKLLELTDSEIILQSKLETYHKHYLLSLKFDDKPVDLSYKNGILTACCEKNTLFSCKSVKCRIHKLRSKNRTIRIYGEVRSPVFDYFAESEILLYAVVNDSRKSAVRLDESCGSYFGSYEKTARFYFFIFTCDVENTEKLSLFVNIRGIELPAECYADENNFFSACLLARGYTAEGRLLTLNNGCIYIRSLRNDELLYSASELLGKNTDEDESLKIRKEAVDLRKERIWLYSDYSSVKKDNGYFQFSHDILKNDGIKRYYITHSSQTDNFTEEEIKSIVQFGSKQHIVLFLSAEKIFASFVDAPNSIFPFPEDKFRFYSDLFRAEIIYLQHGVLHAHIPWRYSPVSEAFHADKIVVSSEFEIENFNQTYHFSREALIGTGMPRYDHIPRKRQFGRKILYAPSWRAYMEDDAVRSFIAKLTGFLNSESLSEFLSKNKLYLDFKPHPMFEKYSELFHFKNMRVRFVNNVKPEEYLVFITDFSSYVFDFAYLSIPVVYFFPDYKDFLQGKYQYRQLDLPFEKAFGRFFETPDDTVNELIRIAENDFLPESNYKKRMERFFLPLNNCCEQLYQSCRNAD